MTGKIILVYCTRILLTAGFFLAFFSSCVPNRKIAYLQNGDELRRMEKVPLDTMVRQYETPAYQYRLQEDDQVDIKISSTTPEEFNPFSLADRYMTTGGSNLANLGQSAVMGYRIDPEGYLNLPVIGKLKAKGMTVYELQDTITNLAARDLEEPMTKVNLMNFRYTIIGEATGAGTKMTSNYNLSILQALADGPAKFGDLSRIKVIRKINNESYIYYINLLDESFLSSDLYYVHPNDVIVVYPMKRRLILENVPQTLGFVASTLSVVLTLFTLISVNK